MKSSTKKGALICIAVLFAVSVLLFSRILHDGLHSINQLGRWSSYKLMGLNGLMGSMEFASGRQTLAHRQLNLGEWHGHNQVFWNKATAWDELGFKFSAERNSYIWVMISISPERQYGFRLSRSPRYPSGFFRLDSHGKFLSRDDINVDINAGWRTVKVSVSDNEVKAELDGKAIFSKQAAVKENQVVSFRSGLHSVSVDDVVIRVNNEVWKENFSPKFKFRYLVFAILLSVDLLLLIAAVTFAFKTPLPEKYFTIVTAQGLLIIVLGSYVAVDNLYWASQYWSRDFLPFNRVEATESLSKSEKFRQDMFKTVSKMAGVKVKKKHFVSPNVWKSFGQRPSDSFWGQDFDLFSSDGENRVIKEIKELATVPKDSLKIVYLGTSQTWGAGSRRRDTSFVAQTAKAYRQSLGVPISILNLSICGSRLSELSSIYRESLKHWRADAMLVNLSNNDMGIPSFESELEELVKTNAQHRIKTAFILEANDPESSSDWILPNHLIMKRVAQRSVLPVLDLHGYLGSKEIYDSGFIWADVVHMDQHGHNLAAEWLVNESLPLLRPIAGLYQRRQLGKR